MKLYLVASVLLLVPLAFAAPPLLAKAIYSDGYVLTESSQESIYYRRNDSFLLFSVTGRTSPSAQDMLLATANASLDDASDLPLSFVIEWVVSPGSHRTMGKQEDFCKSSSSAELRPLIERCSGLVRLRGLNLKETSQIEAFKNEVDETGQNMWVLYDNELMLSKTVELDFFFLALYGRRNGLWIEAQREPFVGMHARFDNYFGKRFVVRGPAENSNCYERLPVEGLKLNYCIGQVLISNVSDDKPKEEKPEENRQEENRQEENRSDENRQREDKPKVPSLEDLNAEQLRMLLKEILGRL